jgi:small subunit ribosomal protein S11
MSEDQDKHPAPAAPAPGDKPAAEKKPKASKPKDKDSAAPKAKDAAKADVTAPDAANAKLETPNSKPETSSAVTAKDLLTDDLGAAKVRRAKGSKNISHGICHILATFNNTKVTFSDLTGNVISWSSSGKCNFRGSRKSTAYAAQVVTQEAGRAAMAHGLKEIHVKVRGPGLGRDSAIRALQTLGLTVSSIMDVTPVPHNGCRPRKRRRV